MEFLDSLDLDTINKKSHRVRSWYLYEQYKSLERSQLDAAQKLKDRSYQERILRQELLERRARRKLYDQFGLCQSESRLKRDKSASNYAQRTTVSTSDDDFFESFYLLQEDERVTQVTGANEFAGDGEGDSVSQEGLSASQCCLANYVTIDDQTKEDNGSYVGSITSVVENLKRDEFIPPQETEFWQNSIDEEINSVHDDMKNSIAEDINMQLDSVQEDIMCLENIAKLEDVDKISEEQSFTKVAVRELKNVQPYVSPIEFAESEKSSTSPNLNDKRKKSVQLRKFRKICEIKPLSRRSKKYIKTRLSERKCSGRHCSHNDWKPFSTQSLANGTDTTVRTRSASEPWCGYAEIHHYREDISPRSSSNGPWSELSKEKPKDSRRNCCKYRNKALNPMLKIAHCIDSILKDIDDPKHDM